MGVIESEDHHPEAASTEDCRDSIFAFIRKLIALNQLKAFYFTQLTNYVIGTYPVSCFDLRAVRHARSQERRF